VKKAQLNLIDKAVAFLNPQGAVNRMIARQKLVNFSYDAVKYTRERKGPSQLSGAEDYRSNYDRVELMKRARDLAENVGLVRSILMKFASHTAANISYQARTENPEVNSDVEAYWSEWWDKCDISTRHTGSTLMQVAVMSMLRDGDFLIVLVRDKDGNLKIQGIEADRVGDPFKVYTSLDLIGGIHIDRTTGAPSAYDIYSRSIGDFYTFQATIPASQAFHLFDPLRIDQYRGVSAFHTAINDCTDIYDIVNFEKMAARVASSQSAVVRRNNNNASDLSTLTNDENVNGDTIKLEAIESGKISYLEPGEDIVFPDGPSRPSGAFAEFHKILLRNICLGLGIPYSFAVDPSAMSGPTARLEMQQAGRTFRRYQKLIDDKVLRPIKNIVLADAVSRGLIENNLGSRTTKGIFNFGANVSIDLGRESASAISEFKTGLRTAADIYAERGLDFESSFRQRAQEAALIKKLAQEYDIPAVAISDIVESLVYAQQAAQRSGQAGGGEGSGEPIVSDVSLNGAQVTSLINVINAVAAGAVSKAGAVSIITAAFPTISIEQANAIFSSTIIGKTIPTTKEEKIQITKDQEGDSSGGSTTPAPEPTPQPTAPTATAQKKSSLEILESLDPASIKMLIQGMMGGIELGKYDGIDFTPPEGAREAAKRALDVRETKPPSQRGMTPVGIARARDLINGVKMSPDTVRRMKAFFDRHEVDKKGATFGEQGKGWQAWNGWGGDAGFSWAKKVVGQMEARDKKTEFVAGRDCGQDEGGTFGPSNECAVGYGRPPLKGGYTPTRPGGKFPKDYKRPTEQKKEKSKGKPLPPKPLPPKPLPPKPLPPKPIEKTSEEKRRDKISESFKQSGVEASLPENIDRASEIEESFSRLKSMGYEVPPPDKILTDNLESRYGKAYAGAFAVATSDREGKSLMIFSTAYNQSGDDIVNQIQDSVDDKWFASKDLFSHEYGHNVHMRDIGEAESKKHATLKFGSGKTAEARMGIASKVSEYARTNPLEFVAETFSGHINGEKYDEDVYELYRFYKGPKLR